MDRKPRNKNAKDICQEYSNGDNCGGDDCPLSKACKHQSGDNYEIWLDRTNRAADEIRKDA